MADDLDELEQRVGEKWAAAAADRFDPEWQIDLSQWELPLTEGDVVPLPPGTLQFPREQWARYPTARRVALLACETLLDRDGELTDAHWMYLCLVMQYGGKNRIA